ncbi:alpha/beta fold hydrolase [Nocardia sp. NPDC050175]|uniref:alpha/beta fold hydrolase n=1 Tax=Nocardia sp. NPDC050175 TaxID=3364317 RepID=UPI0037A88204
MPTVTTPRGVSIHYDEFGEPHHPVMVLIQGHGAHMLGWRAEFCRALAEGGYRVVRFDNRDVGLSQKFPEGGYDLSQMADDAVGLLQALGTGAVHVVGQSMGGMIAQHLAVDHPDWVLSLALVYTAPSIDYAVGIDIIRERLTASRNPTREDAATLYVENEKPCASTVYPQDTVWLLELGRQMYDRCYHPAGIDRQTAAFENSADRSELLSTITVPTTIIHGTADQLVDPAGSRALHALIEHSTLSVFPGMGHEIPKPLWEKIIAQICDNADNAVFTDHEIPGGPATITGTATT